MKLTDLTRARLAQHIEPPRTWTRGISWVLVAYALGAVLTFAGLALWGAHGK